MKAQAAVEYLGIVGIVLAIITTISIIVYQQNETATRLQQADFALKTIASTADNLYAQGPGAKTQISVFIPPGYNASASRILSSSANFYNIISFRINTPAGRSDSIGVSKANLSNTSILPSSAGLKVITLESVGNSNFAFVNITST